MAGRYLGRRDPLLPSGGLDSCSFGAPAVEMAVFEPGAVGMRKLWGEIRYAHGHSVQSADNGGMNWELAHRPRGTYDATAATVEASSAWAAVEELRTQIPKDDLVLFVREARAE